MHEGWQDGTGALERGMGMLLIRNSVRQLFRMRGRALLFFLLLATASGLCSLGRGFLVINREKMAAYEDSFLTIGTVEQKADKVRERMIWDAELKNYHIYNRSVYDTFVPLSALTFEGADYLSGPEKRGFYGAYMPQYEMYGIGMNLGEVVEGSPLEDVVPDHPVKFQVSRVLAGMGTREGNVITFCDHYDPSPEKLYADKTYVMSLQYRPGHESEKEFEGDYVSEYVPFPILTSDQVDLEGNSVADEVAGDHFCDVVTEGFYETKRGKRWMNLVESWDYARHIFPVTGTDDINLLMPFYNGNAYISGGREFTQEEYERGDRVCLVSELFAQHTGLQIGDQLHLALQYANHRRTPGDAFGSNSMAVFSLLNAEGEIYPVFEEADYEIVGTYGGQAGLKDEYGMGYNEILIPSSSVKNSDADNILESGPMTGSTTSFRIANGTIDEYMEQWNKQGISNVEITFYDRGYSELEANINNMKYIAGLLIVMGTVMVLMVLFYFSWLFIGKQGERTAIERALGLQKRQCFLSLFSGIFLILLVGSVCGCTLGSGLAGKIASQIGEESYYDTTFGNSAAIDRETFPQAETVVFPAPMREAAVCTLLILSAGTGIAAVGILKNLGREPMQMFAGGQEAC